MNARCRSASSRAPTSGATRCRGHAARLLVRQSHFDPEAGRLPDRLEPGRAGGRGHQAGASGDGRTPARVGADRDAQSPAVEAPQPHRSSGERAKAFENLVEPPYGRRSVMQMEFPCSLNSTESTSLRIRYSPRPPSVSSCSGCDRVRHRAGIEARPFVGDVHADGVGEELRAYVDPLARCPLRCPGRWRC